MKFQVFGVSTREESQREKEHKALARQAAAEGIVLLKNDNVLPLTTRSVALYGPAFGSRSSKTASPAPTPAGPAAKRDPVNSLLSPWYVRSFFLFGSDVFHVFPSAWG